MFFFKNRSNVLMYHEVTIDPERNKETRKIAPTYSMTVDKFQDQIEYLIENNYEVLSLLDIIKDGSDKPNKIYITFDDGLIGNYEYAFGILERFKCPATFFIKVDAVGQSRFMTWEHLRELRRHGHLIQSHTMSHPMLETCTDKKIYEELKRSKKTIEDKIGDNVNCISLPYGSYRTRVLTIAKEIGYNAIFTSQLYGENRKSLPYVIGRIPIKDNHTLTEFANLTNKNSKYFLKTLMVGQAKLMTKKIIGLGNYRRVYRMFNRIKLEE